MRDPGTYMATHRRERWRALVVLFRDRWDHLRVVKERESKNKNRGHVYLPNEFTEWERT